MIDSCAAGCALRAFCYFFVSIGGVFIKKWNNSFLGFKKDAVHYHLYEQGSGPWARALVHGIPLVNCKIFIIFLKFSSSSSSSGIS